MLNSNLKRNRLNREHDGNCYCQLMILQVNNQHKMSSYTACALTHQIASFEKIATGRTIGGWLHFMQECCHFVQKILKQLNPTT
jgi:hypothetical protein